MVEFPLKRIRYQKKFSITEKDKEIATAFSKRMIDEMKALIKAVVLFGSSSRDDSSKKSDIDVLVIIDDVTINVTPEVSHVYRMTTQKIIQEISKKLHVNTLRLTNFWEYVKNGDPIIINILRDGITLHEEGFIEPLQVLLSMGRIRPTEESVWRYYEKAPITLKNSRWHLLQATVDLYWAVIDAAHAALMSENIIPPSPGHVADMLNEHFVKKGLMHKKYPQIMQRLFDLSKMINHNEMSHISGEEYEVYYGEARDFVEEMKRFVKQ